MGDPPTPSSAVEIWGRNGRGDFQELLILPLSWRVSDAVCLVPTTICKVRVRGANPPVGGDTAHCHLQPPSPSPGRGNALSPPRTQTLRTCCVASTT